MASKKSIKKIGVPASYKKEDSIKSFIKKNIDRIDSEKLDAKYRRYLGAVKGGLSRNKEAVRIDGKFISDNFVKKNALEEKAKAKGYANAKEFLEKDERFYKALKNIYSNEGEHQTFYSTSIFSSIEKFNGKIIINEKEVSKVKAIEMVSSTENGLRRHFNSILNEYNVYFKKGNELHLSLPKNIDDYESEEEFEEENNDVVILYSDSQKETVSDHNKKMLENLSKGKNRRPYYEVIITSKKTKKIIHKYVGTAKQASNYEAMFLNSEKYTSSKSRVKKIDETFKLPSKAGKKNIPVKNAKKKR